MQQRRELVAAGVLDTVAGTPAWSTDRCGFTATITDNGTGDVTINLDEDIASVPAIADGGFGFSYAVLGTAARCACFERVNSSSIRVRIFDLATPSAADAILSIEMWRLISV